MNEKSLKRFKQVTFAMALAAYGLAALIMAFVPIYKLDDAFKALLYGFLAGVVWAMPTVPSDGDEREAGEEDT